MAIIPMVNPIAIKVESGLVEVEIREYLGYSGLAHNCNRYLWYTFRFAYKRFITRQKQRLLARGEAEEALIIAELERVGMVITDKQFEIVDKTGHIKGHIDGKVLNVPSAEKKLHLLEMKTMNDENFKLYKKKGLQFGFPVYYGQINSYMGKLGLERTLYIITNKNTDERIYDRFKFDKSKFEELEMKGFDVLTSELPPEKIGQSTWFECKMCDARGICHKGEEIAKSCRTCKHACIEEAGKWSCEINNFEMSIQYQRVGCEKYEKMDGI